MTRSIRPPRLARRLLQVTLPRDVREDVPGDLEEMFNRRQHEQGPARARVWFWRQTAAFSAHFLLERLRERRREDLSTGFSWIDLRLAVRMLVRYPGLTIVSVLGMAVGITIAAGAFTIASGLLDPTVPLEEGDRVVSIVTWDTATNNREQRTLHDFGTWRAELESVQQIGAFRAVGRNLIAQGAQPETVTVAEMSASAFLIARASPALGRPLLPEDERPDAPDVVVIGDDVWRRRFGADPEIVGRRIQLGETIHTVVGVMPPGFEFPVDNGYWVPLRLDPLVHSPRSGPSIYVFARLAAGATIESAQSELTAIGQRASASSPSTHEHLRPRVLPYPYAFTDMDDPENALVLHVTQALIVSLLVIVCVNVAILVYARTATRQGEIAVRSALGASRRRIVAQLFLEALVLASAAAVVGVGLVSLGLRQLDAALRQVGLGVPFWMTFQLSAPGILYIVGLTVVSGAIVGVVPALKATGRRVQVGLQSLSAGAGSKMQMGRLWTTLVVAQVAIAVALLPATVFHAWSSLRFRTGDRGFASQEFVTTRLSLDRPATGASTIDERLERRYASTQAELERALEEDGAVADATVSLVSPGEELAAVLEVEGMPAPAEAVDYNIVEGSKYGRLVRFNRVAIDFFDAYDVPVLMGRGFQTADLMPGAAPVLVNRTFAEQMFGGENALGRRVRYIGRSREAGEGHIVLDRWHEIVGIVPDFPAHATQTDGGDPRLYHPIEAGDLRSPMLAIRVRGTTPSNFAPRLREISAAVDPGLQLRGISSFEDAAKREQGLMRLIGGVLIGITLSVVVLSGAGIYALMSFTVARRRKEIGIRAALGADPGRILAGIFSRALAQLGVGAALGIVGAIGMEQLLEGEMLQGHGVVILPVVALIMTIVGLVAAYAPARRGLRIQPTEALRAE